MGRPKSHSVIKKPVSDAKLDHVKAVEKLHESLQKELDNALVKEKDSGTKGIES